MKRFIAGLSVLAAVLAFGTAFAGEMHGKDKGERTEGYYETRPTHEKGSDLQGAGTGGIRSEDSEMREVKRFDAHKVWDELLKPTGGYDIAN